MQPKIELKPEMKFVGMKMQTSFANNKTYQLWRGFMPRRKEIPHAIGSEIYSIEVYPEGFYDAFDPSAEFEKWAAVEVTGLLSVPDGMETLVSPEGLYAIFIHRGPASEGPKTYGYIFQTWLPTSGYVLDARPHFAVMGEKYNNDSPDSEEEIWIPVRAK